MAYISGGTLSGVVRLKAPAATPAVSPAGEGRIYFDGTVFKVSENGAAYVNLAGGGGGTLASVLAAGNTTGANNIIVSTGQEIRGQTALTLTSIGTGNQAALQSQSGTGITNSGDVYVQSGLPDFGVGGHTSGALYLITGTTDGAAGVSGDVNIYSGGSTGAGSYTGSISISVGDADQFPGSLSLTGGRSAIGTGGGVTITGGDCDDTTGLGGGPVMIQTSSIAPTVSTVTTGTVTVRTGASTGGNSGPLLVYTGNANTGDGVSSGDLTISTGSAPFGTTTQGGTGDILITTGGMTGTSNAQTDTTGTISLVCANITGDNSNGGLIFLTAGNATGANAVAGTINITGGDASGTGSTGGPVNILPGDGATPGQFYVLCGSATSGSGAQGGGISMEAGAGDGAGQGGDIFLYGGQPGASGNGGWIYLAAAGGIGLGGSIDIAAGSASAGNTGGDVILRVDDSGGITIGTVKLATSTTQKLRFYGTAAGTAQQTVTGSRGGNAALADLLTKLATLGLIVDGTTA